MASKIPMGYRKCEDLSASIGLDDSSFTDEDEGTGIPGGAHVAVLQPLGQAIRWRDDGADPTAESGMYIEAGEYFPYDGPLWRLKVIEVEAGATLHVSYYQL